MTASRPFSLDSGFTPSISDQPLTTSEYVAGMQLAERLEQAFTQYGKITGIQSPANYELVYMGESEVDFVWEERWSYGGYERHTASMPTQFLFDRKGWATAHAPEHLQQLLQLEREAADAPQTTPERRVRMRVLA